MIENGELENMFSIVQAIIVQAVWPNVLISSTN